MIACFGFYLVNIGRGSEAIPFLGAIALGAQRLLPTSQKIYEGFTNSRAQIVQLENIVNLIESKTNEYNKNLLEENFKLTNKIVFEDVSFRYSSDSKQVCFKKY